MADDEVLFIRYRLRFTGGEEKVFTARLDPETLELQTSSATAPPDWTRLEFEQCPNCPLKPESSPRCPVAVNLADVIEFLTPLRSYEQVEVTVESRERTYRSGTSLQTVAGSLMGIYMVTSGCPVLNKMRPMVETHLPFASWRETCYRAMTMYLFAQYTRMKNGLEPRWDLQGLVDYYDQVQQVNLAFSQRLNAIPQRKGDASLNAVSILSSHAAMATMRIQDDDLKHWERIFMDHWS